MASMNAKMRLWTRDKDKDNLVRGKGRKKKPKQNKILKGIPRRLQEIKNLQAIPNRNENQEKRLKCLLRLQATEEAL